MKLALALFGLVACSPPPVTRVAPKPERLDAGTADAGTLPSFEALASHGPVELPAMREAARVEHTTKLSPAVDTCYRALVASDGEVKASFADAAGLRGDPGVAGLVPPRGPVCARKGETLRFVLDGAPARAIVWQAP